MKEDIEPDKAEMTWKRKRFSDRQKYLINILFIIKKCT